MQRHMGKVFGIGLSKTGTKSLSLALELLGYRTKHFPLIKSNIQQAQYQLAIMEEYDAITDAPAAALFPHLDSRYPGSKFILTVRDKKAWLRSCERWYGMRDALARQEGSLDLANFWRLFTFGCHGFNSERFSYVYGRHLREVTWYFRDRRDDLLIIDLCAHPSWEPLCAFLNTSIPNCKFPHENSTDEYASKVLSCLSEEEIKQFVH